MRITGFDIQEGRIGGLKALKADKLGDVVVLAGRNGAGKTRLMRFLSAWPSTELPHIAESPRSLLGTIKRKNFLTDENLGDGDWNSWCADSNLWRKVTLRYSIAQRRNLELGYNHLLELKIESQTDPEIIHFVPKRVRLSDPRDQTKKSKIERSEKVASALGLEEIEDCALARIQHLQDRYWEIKHQDTLLDPASHQSDIENYLSLKTVIKLFMKEELGRSVEGDATLFGLPIGQGLLSDGQCILLQFCVAIHSHADRLSELIVMMDEPENHLHPAAMLDAINVIRNHLTKGQLWIATHSLPLLANFDPDCIWWMDEGSLSHAGSSPEVVLKGLLGDTERIEQLENFLGLPAAMAINNFTAQCLLTPTVVMTGSEDKQLQQIQKALLGLKQADKPLSVLDVGAGRGRLISALAATLPDTAQALDYLAFDPSTIYKQECEDAIARCYAGEAKQRWFGSLDDLKVRHSGKSMDVVVMCNVLHEIDPSLWLNDLFGPHGIVGHFLADNGYLLIVEDTEMRIGEKAHDKGFLVLNTGNLRTLFAIKADDHGFRSETQQNGRLIATLIPAECICRATRETLMTTLGEVKHEASQKIRVLRQDEKSTSYRNGRKLAFHLQQFANAALTVEAMGGN